MPTDRALASDPSPRTPGRRVIAGQETTLLLHHRPDGTVTAHARGFTGIGRSVVEALADLEREMGVTPTEE